MHLEPRKKQKEFEANYVEGKNQTAKEDIMKLDSKGNTKGCKGPSKINKDLPLDEEIMDEDNTLVMRMMCIWRFTLVVPLPRIKVIQ